MGADEDDYIPEWFMKWAHIGILVVLIFKENFSLNFGTNFYCYLVQNPLIYL